MLCAVIFGGTGFIGSFFARHLVEEGIADKVYLYDSESLSSKSSTYRQNMLEKYSNVVFVEGDVRTPISWIPAETVALVANFAAVHREPGHEDYEYYECNLSGAENVCDWAELVACNRIIFTSSIAPYGPSEEVKDEQSIPTPTTAYGGSKLAAEKIHQIWQAKDTALRQLVVVRPGVVFGPGEGGNVSRLIKAVTNRYFFYTGNRRTRKAGTYVKELCHAVMWVLDSEKAKADGVSVFNMSMNPGPTIQDYVETIAKVAQIRVWVPSLPTAVLFTGAYIIEGLLRPLGIKHPFNPLRVKKLVRSNNILPTYLVQQEYEYKYSLDDAFNDWKYDCPEEW